MKLELSPKAFKVANDIARDVASKEMVIILNRIGVTAVDLEVASPSTYEDHKKIVIPADAIANDHRQHGLLKNDFF